MIRGITINSLLKEGKTESETDNMIILTDSGYLEGRIDMLANVALQKLNRQEEIENGTSKRD